MKLVFHDLVLWAYGIRIKNRMMWYPEKLTHNFYEKLIYSWYVMFKKTIIYCTLKFVQKQVVRSIDLQPTIYIV